MNTSITFNGFEPANTTAVPDAFFDELLPLLNGAELKAMLYIIRRTLGFKKTTDTISFNQFLHGITTKNDKVLDKGCGVKDRTTLSKALARLEALNCITTTKSKNDKKENEVTAYSIKFRSQGVVGKSYHPSRENRLPLVGKTDYRSREIPQGVVGKSYPQETVIQETVIQETERERETPTDTQPAPLSDIALAHPTPLPLSVFADENLHVDMPPLSTQRVVLSAREGVAEPVAMLNDEADRAVIAHMLSQQGNPNSVFYLPPAPTQPVLAPVADIAAPQEDNAVTVTTEPLPRNPIAAAAASSLTPDVDIQTETPAGKKPPKGKGAKVTPDQKARMGKVMNYIDSLLQEVTGDPDEGYSRTTKIGQDALYTLLFGRKHSERRVTQERVRKVFLAMWNEPRNTRTGYYLRENMGYNKICEEYEKRIHSLIAEENGKGKGAATSNGIIDLVEWQGRKMSQAEAKKLGYTGFEKYIGNGPDDLAELDRITANSPEIQALIREALEA